MRARDKAVARYSLTDEEASLMSGRLAFPKGTVLDHVDKNSPGQGWWTATYQGSRGHVPANRLRFRPAPAALQDTFDEAAESEAENHPLQIQFAKLQAELDQLEAQRVPRLQTGGLSYQQLQRFRDTNMAQNGS